MADARSFDIDEALDTAMNVVWAFGYEGTSVGMLCEAVDDNAAAQA